MITTHEIEQELHEAVKTFWQGRTFRIKADTIESINHNKICDQKLAEALTLFLEVQNKLIAYNRSHPEA